MLGHSNGHLEDLSLHGNKVVYESLFYEFGAGWDLAIPFCLYALGVKSQILVDISELARVELIENTVARLNHLNGEVSATQLDARLVPEKEREAWIHFLEKQYGIRYVAPCDARSTRLQAESVDCITSTDTLEHIPEEDIRLILRECRRILRKDGVLSFVIDYQDRSEERRVGKECRSRWSP